VSVSIACPACNASLRVDEKIFGKRCKCPKCGEVMIAPSGPAAEPPSRPEAGRVSMATDRQKEYAHELGIEFKEPISRREISKLIDQATEARDLERYRRLDELQHRETEAWKKMREEVSEELREEDTWLSDATLEEVLEECENRNITAILITVDNCALNAIFDFTEENMDISGVSVGVQYTDDLDEDTMRRVVKILGTNMLTQDGGY